MQDVSKCLLLKSHKPSFCIIYEIIPLIARFLPDISPDKGKYEDICGSHKNQ